MPPLLHQIEAPESLPIVHSEASCGWGGQEHRVLVELKEFKALGHPVALVAPRTSILYARCMEAGIPAFHVSFKRSALLPETFRLIRFLNHWKPAVVNTHSSRDGWCMGLAARISRVPLLIRSRHIDVDYKSPRISTHAFTTLADHVITTSDAITAKLTRILHVPSDRISTVATGVDLTRFSPDGKKADLGNLESGPRIGMISVLRSWKGHSNFFQAIRILIDSGFRGNFFVVGGGAPVENFVQISKDCGVEKFIKFTGHREDIPDVIRALDLVVIPSTRHEGIPQIGLQSLACTTPVIGSSVGGIPEIIRHGITGRIFSPNAPASLAQTVREVFLEKEKTVAFSQSGLALVRDSFSLEAMTRKIRELYRTRLLEKIK